MQDIYQLAEQAIASALTEPEPGGDADASEKRIVFHRALELVQGKFETRTWDAFWRMTVDGQSAASVATDLAMSRNAVYLARSRVLRRLREEFREWTDPDLLEPGEGTSPGDSRRKS